MKAEISDSKETKETSLPVSFFPTMSYPLEITRSLGGKMAESLFQIMAQVPNEIKLLITDDYSSTSTALWNLQL